MNFFSKKLPNTQRGGYVQKVGSATNTRVIECTQCLTHLGWSSNTTLHHSKNPKIFWAASKHSKYMVSGIYIYIYIWPWRLNLTFLRIKYSLEEASLKKRWWVWHAIPTQWSEVVNSFSIYHQLSIDRFKVVFFRILINLKILKKNWSLIMYVFNWHIVLNKKKFITLRAKFSHHNLPTPTSLYQIHMFDSRWIANNKDTKQYLWLLWFSHTLRIQSNACDYCGSATH